MKILFCFLLVGFGLSAQDYHAGSIAHIGPDMGFVVSENRVVVLARAEMHVGDTLAIDIDGIRMLGGRIVLGPPIHTSALVVRVNRSAGLALLSIKMKARPLPLASYVIGDQQPVYRYMRTAAPRTRMNIFQGVQMVWARAGADLESSFKSIPGGPITDGAGEVVGIVTRQCADGDWRSCSVPADSIRRLLSTQRASR